MLKKILALTLALVLLLALTGCTEEAKLYKKHAEIVDLLEAEEYYQAINKITGMIYDKQNEGKERPDVLKLLNDTWYVTSDSSVSVIEFGENNTCVVDGQQYNWLEEYSDDTRIEGYIMAGGEYKYYFSFKSERNDIVLPQVSLYTCKINGESVYSDQNIGTFRNHDLIKLPIQDWKLLDGDPNMSSYLYLYEYNFYYKDTEYYWSITSEKGQMPMELAFISRVEGAADISATISERDGYLVLEFFNNTTGEYGFFVKPESGYEPTWAEARYPVLIYYLKSYLNGNGFRPEGYENYLYNNEALQYLHEQFVDLGDYKLSADIASRVTIVPSKLTEVVQYTTDQLNNVSSNELEEYKYDATGKMIAGDGATMMETWGVYETYDSFNFEYDASGKVSRINIGSNSGICVPTYDAQGNIISMDIQRKDRQYTSTFTYDDQGRLAEVYIPAGNVYETYLYTYTYDDAGKLIQSTKSWDDDYYGRVYDYVYEGDALVQMVESILVRQELRYTITYDYTNDAQGRHLRADITTTDENVTYKERHNEYVYIDWYFLNSDGLEFPEG